MHKDYTTPGERTVARRLVNAILAAGHLVSVNDGEEWTVLKSRSTTEIIDALASTGEDYIRVRHSDGGVVGTFCLIWGNDPTGEELITDHTDNAEMNALANAAQR